MKAYFIIYKKGGQLVRKNGISLEEAKQLLTKKEFEKLCSFRGIHTMRVDGYIK